MFPRPYPLRAQRSHSYKTKREIQRCQREVHAYGRPAVFSAKLAQALGEGEGFGGGGFEGGGWVRGGWFAGGAVGEEAFAGCSGGARGGEGGEAAAGEAGEVGEGERAEAKVEVGCLVE